MTTAASPVAALFRVEGRVQGVAFRASTRRQAQALGLRGYAINLADGAVEVLAVGAADAVDALHDWLHRGPPLAKVTAVQRAPGDAGAAGEGFAIG